MDFTTILKKYTELIQLDTKVIKNIIVYIISIIIFPSIISESNYLYGILFTIIIMFYSYWIHMVGHRGDNTNLFKSIHLYHHTHNDYISYYGQIFTEIIFELIIRYFPSFTGGASFNLLLIFSTLNG